MRKLPTIFPKDPKDLGRVIDGPIIEGIDHFKLKIDGTACMIKHGRPYCRYDAKLFKRTHRAVTFYTKEEVQAKLPEGAIPCQEPDELSGHWPHWIPVLENNPSQKYILEGFNNLEKKQDGTYECIGPKLQGNPHGEDCHIWIPHFHDNLIFGISIVDYDTAFEFLEGVLEFLSFEGLVAYNESNKPIGKIRRSDFGYPKISYGKASYLVK